MNEGRGRSSNGSVVLSGWYGHGNTGDEAILQQFIAEMIEPNGLTLDVLSEAPENVTALYGARNVTGIAHPDLVGRSLVRDIFSRKVRQHLSLIWNARLLAVGGGGILRDNISRASLFRLLDDIWLAKAFGVPVALYAIGAGPYTTRLGKWLVRQSLKLCDLITVREETSKTELVGIGVPAEKVIVTADPALLLEPAPIADKALRERLLGLIGRKRTIGLFVEKDDTPIAQIAEALDKLHAEHGFTMLGIPMRSFEGRDDRKVARMIRDSMRHPEALELLEIQLSPPEIKWLIGQLPFNITVRLHALIFSLSMGVPAIAINYQPKVLNMLRSFGLEQWCIELGSNNIAGELVGLALSLSADAESYKARIKSCLIPQQQLARQNFVLLQRLMERRGGLKTHGAGALQRSKIS